MVSIILVVAIEHGSDLFSWFTCQNGDSSIVMSVYQRVNNGIRQQKGIRPWNMLETNGILWRLHFTSLGMDIRTTYYRFWVNYHDLTVLPHLESVLVREIMPFYGRTIQVSELF